MRRKLQPTRTATTLQVTSMLLVLLGVTAIFVHALRNPGGSATIQHPSEPSSEISLIIAP